jgi:hypothetical protein
MSGDFGSRYGHVFFFTSAVVMVCELFFICIYCMRFRACFNSFGVLKRLLEFGSGGELVLDLCNLSRFLTGSVALAAICN